MKRSSAISLAIIGSLAMAGCTQQPEEPKTYATIGECIADGKDKTVCESSWAEADKLTKEQAPRFADKAACEAQFGAGGCQTGGDGSTSWFMPALMGYMIGNMMGNSSSSAAYQRGIDDERRRGGGTTYIAPRPVYRTQTGGLSAAAFSGGKMTTTPAPTTYAASRAATTSARGGFGSSARSSSVGG